MNVEEKYKKLTQREHILLRSGMYIGETKKTIEEKWVFDVETEKIIKKVVEYSPAFLKLFDEILTNATDHSFRDKTLTQIKININIETGEISVYNNGEGIPVVIHKEHNIYVPELIFGHLLSGENYNDNTKRIGGGMNGLGATLVNIYSTFFKVETVDSNLKLKFEQVFKNNMLEKSKPKITKSNVKSYTRITYITDFKRFGMNLIDKDTLSLLLKRVYDTIVCTDKKISIYYNDKKIDGKGLLDYIKYYNKTSKIYEQQVLSDNFIWEYIIVPNDTYEQMSFVNGICTTNGGKHVDCIMTQIITNMKKMLESKKKLKDVKQNMIKERIFIFLRATIINPTFNSQTKEVLTTPIKDFGYKIETSEKFITKVWKSEIIEMIEKSYKLKEQVELEKTSSSTTRKNKLYIPKLEDAHFAGTLKSNKCTLILTEGDSAKTFAMWGRTIIGSDYYGVFSLKGKILNIRDATTSQLLNNEEFNNIKKIIGLQHNKQYKNVNDLRYGKVMLLMDADSVTYDTPCLIKNINTNKIEYKPICEIYDNDIWNKSIISDKEYNTCQTYLVWSDNGWTKIKSVMRHKVNKPIYRVLTHTGCVDVTEDHSLLDKTGNEITVNDITIKETELLHSKYVNADNDTDFNINEEYAWALGYFQADGNCTIDGKVKNKRKDGSITHSLNYNWSISSVDKCNLEKLKTIFDNYENNQENCIINDMNNTNDTINNNNNKTDCVKKEKKCPKCNKFFKRADSFKSHLNIKSDCSKKNNINFVIEKLKVSKDSYSHQSGREYKYILIAKGNRKTISVKYRSMFYNSLREKKIPLEILNNTTQVQKSFLDGFYAGDGNKGYRTTDQFDGEYKSQIAGLFQLLQNCGYTPSLNCNNKKLNVYTILQSKSYNRPEYTVKKIINVSEKYKDTYVYDFETENHHFHGSIGNIIVHNCDASHITGLFINAIHYYWPELLKLNFIQKLKTPIIRIPQKNLEFFTEQDYNKWKSLNTTKNLRIKYYKGLGTSQKEDAKNIFKRLNELLVNFNYRDEKCNEAILLAFSKDKETSANKRKEWLKEYDKNIYLDLNDKNICYSDFINKELIHFSNYDNIRSIPQLMDGLKPSQRKILYYMLKNNITKSIKVAQLSGYVSAETSYHHGEASLQQAIISMAQDFIGTNNINLLYPDGNHGCLDPLTKIVVENGVKYAKDIKINDKVLGDDGNLRTVLQITKGQDIMYKIYYTKNEYYIVNSQHLLTLKYKTKSSKKYTIMFDKDLLKQVKVKNNKEIQNIIDIKVKDYINLPHYVKMKFTNVYYNKILEWNTNTKIKIQPYIYANWLMCRLTKSKIETKCLNSYVKWKVFCDENNIQMTKINMHKNIFKLSSKWSDKLNEMNYSINHYNNIPPEYIYTDYEMRLEFIYGLIDGRCKIKNNWCKIDLQQSKELFKSIVKLLKTLPLKYNVKIYKTKFNNYNYSIWININKIKKRKTNILYKVEEIGYGSYVGFEIDGNNRFVIETSNKDYIITHNSRLLGGKDSASPRYIYTYLNEITNKIFDKKDVKLLKNVEDDGLIVEPEYYIPIIPLVLINGCEGIGTGYSTFIPPCNPKEIIENIKRKITNKNLIELQPYYKNFKGSIIKIDDNKYQIKGKWKRKMNTIIITELPIGVWITTYKEMIEKKIKDENATIITDIKNISQDENTNIQIIITFKSSEILDKLEKNNELETMLKLVKTLSTNNMYLFLKSSLKKYKTLNDIFLDYYELRLEYYKYRKLLLEKELQDELNILQQKLKFITEFINGDINIIHKEIDEIHTQLHNRKYILYQDSYDYLTNMQIKSLTKTKITELTKNVEFKTMELEKLQKSSQYDLWLNDLNEIEKLI